MDGAVCERGGWGGDGVGDRGDGGWAIEGKGEG